jgi:hypothetical protein
LARFHPFKPFDWRESASWHLKNAAHELEGFLWSFQQWVKEKGGNMSPALLLITALAGGISQILSAEKNKSLQTAGVDLQLADDIALAVLQATAQVKGATIDWTDPAAVADYIKALPAFVPLPDPAAPPEPGPGPITQ